MAGSGSGNRQLAEETVLFVVRPGGEEEFIGIAGITPITESQCPETVNLDGIAVAVLELTEEVAASVKSIDPTVAKVTDQ